MSGDLGNAVLDLSVDKSQLRSGLSGARADVEREVRTMGQKTKDLGASLTRTLTPIAAGLGLAFRQAFKEWDGGVDAIRVGTGATGAELKKLEESMKRVGRNVTQPLNEVGQVMADLATRTGLTGRPLEKLTTQVLNLARITGGDAQASVAGITRLFGDWGIKTNQMTPTLDKLFRVSQATGIGIQELSELMVQFGSPLRNLGLDFETSAAMFSKFEQEGVNIQTVMPGLKMALKNFAAAGREPSVALQETFEAMKNAKSESELMTIAFETFGARAGPDLAAAVREGRFEFGSLIDTMNNGSDTIAKATADTTDLEDRMAMWRNTIVGMVGPIGEWMSVLMGAVATIGPALFGLGIIMDSTVGKWVASFARMVGSAVAATAQHVAAVARQVAAWALLGVQALAHAAKVALAWLIALGPIAIVVAAVIALVALIVLNFDKIKEWIGKAWDWVKEKTSNAWNNIKETLSNLWARIKEIVGDAVQAVKDRVATAWQAVKDKTSNIWQSIKDFFSNVWQTLKQIPSNAVQAIRDLLANAWNAMRSKVQEIWTAIKSALSDAWQAMVSTARDKASALKEAVVERVQGLLAFIRSIPARIVSALGNLGSLLVDAGRALISGLLNGIKAGLSAVWSEVSSIAGKIKNLKGPIDKDRRLLVDEGKAIMGGLTAGLGLGFDADVAPMLRAITAGIAGTGDPGVRTLEMGGIHQTIQGMQPGDVQRETERALRRTVVAWDLP